MTAPGRNDVVVRAPEADDEWRQCFRISAVGFNGPITPEAEEEQLSKFHRDRCLAVFVGDEVAAWSQVRPFGQFYGGRSVCMGGFSPVAAAPEHRGRGFGSLVTSAQFPSMRERGEVIAGLYPAQTQLYRGNGFEVAGVFAHRTFPTRSLHKLRPTGAVRVRRATVDDLPAIKECYRRFAATQPGWLDRPDVWWDEILPGEKVGKEQHLFAVEADSRGALAGYLRYSHQKARPHGYTIVVHEVCASDPDLMLALWRLVGTSSTQAELVQATGPPEHPLLLVLPDQDLKTIAEIRWMLRVIDAPAAVAARGFPCSVRASVDVELFDRQCEWNAGRWRLSIEGGSATMSKGGDGDVALSINALSSLYSGYASATTLRQAGLIARGDERSLDALTSAFAGPTPSIVDFY